MIKHSEVHVTEAKESSQGEKKTWCRDDFTATSEQPHDLTTWGCQVESTAREQDLNGGMTERRSMGVNDCSPSTCMEHLQKLP